MRKRKLTRLLNEEERCKNEFYSFKNSPLALSMTDESIDMENYLYNRLELAIKERRDYEKKSYV